MASDANHELLTQAIRPARPCTARLRRADPRLARRPTPTNEHYDRAHGNLDRHHVHFLTTNVACV